MLSARGSALPLVQMRICLLQWGTIFQCRAEMETQHAGSSPWISSSDAPTLVVDTLAANHGRPRYAPLRAAAPLVVPSLLLCDFGHLADEVHKLEAAGVRALHLDVMDGHFVPNLTYGMLMVEAVRRVTDLPIEAHLMISEPARYAEQFFSAGADAVTFHVEAIDDPRPLLENLHSKGAIAGLAYNPGTPLSTIADYLDACDLVLTMSVSPGFGGQEFQSVALEKLRHLSRQVGPDVLLEVDGGVNAQTIGPAVEAGAHLQVVGSAIFSHPDYAHSVATLTRLANQAGSRTH
jgi:ribulose-phosphate 3-epimerase